MIFLQLIAGIFEFKIGNTFGATVSCAYGSFWLSYGVIYIPGFGILDAYKNDSTQLHNAIAVYDLTWLIFTLIFTICATRINVAVLSSFVLMSITLVALITFHFAPSYTFFIKFGGIAGVITSLNVWYCVAATLLPEITRINVPVWDLSHKN